MSTSLFSETPLVTASDNRGLNIRSIEYHRLPGTPQVTRERITRHHYDGRGFLGQSADPRLHDAGLTNFAYLTDVAGNVVRTQGTDNGTTVSLNDAAGRPFLTVSNLQGEDTTLAVTRTWTHEDTSLPGRPLSVTEQVAGEVGCVTERFIYAGDTDAEKARNLAGQCVRHYETAGQVQTDTIALTGVQLSVTRRLLVGLENPDVVAHWRGEDESTWNELLEGQAYKTQAKVDATGAVLTTTDAKGNLQRVAYGVAGLLSGSWLKLKGDTQQVIVKSLAYSAAGQKLREEHGNGVVVTYTYAPKTQRLIRIETERPTGHLSGASVLQDLRYEYDPVGNVLSIRNDAEESRFWRNQKVVPEHAYGYDSLYQLVSATGREMANAGQQGSQLPPLTAPLPPDSAAYTNFTRTYTYDSAGNLTQICHNAPVTNNSYTTDITVSDRSNRGVLSTLTQNPAGVDALFTASGQQTQLQPGQALTWTPRNELLKVTLVVRDGNSDEGEDYRYDGDNQRILKVSSKKASGTTHVQRVVYLPGLELRSGCNGGTEAENLQVITAGVVDSAQVRVLRWDSGKPDGINNDQVRWSYGDLTGSSGVELDGGGNIISLEEYYPYGGTAVWAARSSVEAHYKTIRYSGKERDATGLYYYGYRYYQPWVGRWLSADPAGTVDGLNLYRMVRNNPTALGDGDGLSAVELCFGLFITAVAMVYFYFYHRPAALQSISNPGKIAAWAPGSMNDNYIVVHMVREDDSDFYERPAEDALTARDIFSASLIDVTEVHGRGGYRYTGAYAESGFIINIPPQNIIGTHDQDISFPTHIGRQGYSGKAELPYKLVDEIARPPRAGYSFTGKPFPRIASYINMLSPDELRNRKAEAQQLLPNPKDYRNEILAVGKDGVRVHEDSPPTEAVRVRGILIASRFADGKPSEATEVRVARLHARNPHLDVYTLTDQRLNLVKRGRHQ